MDDKLRRYKRDMHVDYKTFQQELNEATEAAFKTLLDDSFPSENMEKQV